MNRHLESASLRILCGSALKLMLWETPAQGRGGAWFDYFFGPVRPPRVFFDHQISATATMTTTSAAPIIIVELTPPESNCICHLHV